MKVALICCGRLENRYAVEWVEYYKQLGIDHIYIADNNYDEEEHFEDVLQQYLDEQFITILNYRNIEKVQKVAYTEIYNQISKDYDWICIFDFDEFLTFTKDKNIKEYLSRDCFKYKDQILINWLSYTDNNLIYDDGRPCLERFTELLDPNICVRNKFEQENKIVKHKIKTPASAGVFFTQMSVPSEKIRKHITDCFSLFRSLQYFHYSSSSGSVTYRSGDIAVPSRSCCRWRAMSLPVFRARKTPDTIMMPSAMAQASRAAPSSTSVP